MHIIVLLSEGHFYQTVRLEYDLLRDGRFSLLACELLDDVSGCRLGHRETQLLRSKIPPNLVYRFDRESGVFIEILNVPDIKTYDTM